MDILAPLTATNSYASSTTAAASDAEAIASTATDHPAASDTTTYTSSTAADAEALASTATDHPAISDTNTTSSAVATSEGKLRKKLIAQVVDSLFDDRYQHVGCGVLSDLAIATTDATGADIDINFSSATTSLASTDTTTTASVTTDLVSSSLQRNYPIARMVANLIVLTRKHFGWDALSAQDKCAINALSNCVLEKTTHSDSLKALMDLIQLAFLHKDAGGWFYATVQNQALLEPILKQVNTAFEQHQLSPFVRFAREQNVAPLQALLNPENLLQIGDSERPQQFSPDRYLFIPPEATDAKEKSEMVGSVYTKIVYQRKVTESDKVCPYVSSCPLHKKGQCDGKLIVHKTVAVHITDVGKMQGKLVAVLTPYLRCPFQNRLKSKKQGTPVLKPVFKGLIPVDISDVRFLNTSMTNAAVADIIFTLMKNREGAISTLQQFYGFGSSQPVNNIARLYWFVKHVYANEQWVKDPEAGVLIPDEFYALDCEFFTIFVNGKTHEVMGLVEGKTKARIQFMMDSFKAKGFELKIMAADDNASFKAAAKLVWGDNFKFVCDPFHFLQAWSKEIAVPIVRYLLKTDRKALEALKEAGNVLSEDNKHLDGLSVEDTAHITMLLRYHVPLDKLQEILRNKGKDGVADYIGNHPILSNLFSANYEIHALVHSDDHDAFIQHFFAAQHHLQQVVALSNGKLKTAKTMIARLNNKRESLINYLTTGYTSSIIEGFNCKIKSLKRCMRGAINACSFMLRVKALFEPKPDVVHQAKWAA